MQIDEVSKLKNQLNGEILQPKIYISRMDVVEEYRSDFFAWCKNRHWPDLIGAGFFSANGYTSVTGGPFVCNIYEIPGVEVFLNGYESVRSNDEQLKVIVSQMISNHSLTVYDQLTSFATSGDTVQQITDKPMLRDSVMGPAVLVIRFEARDLKTSDVLDFFRAMFFPRLAAYGGFIRGRLLRQAGKHPVYPSTQSEWCVVVEWASLADASRREVLLSNIIAETGSVVKFGEILENVGKHVCSIRNPDTWG